MIDPLDEMLKELTVLDQILEKSTGIQIRVGPQKYENILGEVKIRNETSGIIFNCNNKDYQESEVISILLSHVIF